MCARILTGSPIPDNKIDAALSLLDLLDILSPSGSFTAELNINLAEGDVVGALETLKTLPEFATEDDLAAAALFSIDVSPSTYTDLSTAAGLVKASYVVLGSFTCQQHRHGMACEYTLTNAALRLSLKNGKVTFWSFTVHSQN